MSGSATWSGDTFPEDILSAQADITIYETSISFSKGPGLTPLAGVTWPQGLQRFSAPFAARARGYLCTATRAWQQLALDATPGTQLRVDSVTAARTAREAGSGTYPRGNATHAVHYHWLAPGCHELEVLFYEPPPCGANHVERMSVDAGRLQTYCEVKVAYTNASVVVCADFDCKHARELQAGPQSKAMEVAVGVRGGALVQTVTLLNADGQMDGSRSMVRGAALTLWVKFQI